MEIARVAIPAPEVVVPVVLEDANMVVDPVVLEDAKKDVVVIVKTPALGPPQVSPPINLNHLLAQEEEVVVVTAPVDVRIAAVLVAERPVQMIVPLPVKELVDRAVVNLVPRVVPRHVRAHANKHVKSHANRHVQSLAEEHVIVMRLMLPQLVYLIK